MAEIQPFRAFRYDLGRVGSLHKVVAPPYDVIDDAFLARLRGQHENNVVHVDMPRPEPGEAKTDDCYARAGRRLKDWIRDGVVKQDSARSLYVYHQEFEVDGRRHTRKGFFARVRLESFATGTIRPHEETFAGPKADRLKLLEATAMNLSPVFGLFADSANEIQDMLEGAIGRQPPMEATDHLGVVGRLWPVTDQQVISKVTGLMGSKHILIADGHHRFETCLQHAKNQLGTAFDQPGDDPVRYALMAFVGMADPGLLVQPTHRLISGIRFDPSLLAEHFAIQSASHADAAWEKLELEVGQGGLAFGTKTGPWTLAKPKNLDAMRELAADHGDDWRSLSVSVLHRLVLGRLIAGQPKIEYVHQLGEVKQALQDGQCDVGILVPAVPVDLVAKIADAGERMPQKSTYFYPKLQTGFLFNPLFTN